MQPSCMVRRCFLCFAVILAMGGTPMAEAGDFTLGLKAWNASLSGRQIDGDSGLFPGVYFSWDVNDRLWISAGYVEGEVDFTIRDSTFGGFVEEVDSDLIVGWSFAKLDIGVGFRFAEFTVSTLVFDVPDISAATSTGPMVYLGGGDLFGQTSPWGYYWGLAYMFADLDDDGEEDSKQKHLNGEAGLRWTSKRNFSILLGYRYKEYSGGGSSGTSFSGPVVNLAYTWR